MIKRLVLLSVSVFSLAYIVAEVPDSTRISYRIPAKVKVNNAFAVPEKKASPVVKSSIYDSLSSAIMALDAKNDSLQSLANEQQALLQSATTQLRNLTEENKNLENELASANGDKLQSSHTNSILFIFNVMLAILLLVTLLWMLNKKKTGEQDKASANGFSSNGKQEAYAAIPTLDNRFERIEKLGNLREKGLLTDEEFTFQKKQILAERT